MASHIRSVLSEACRTVVRPSVTVRPSVRLLSVSVCLSVCYRMFRNGTMQDALTNLTTRIPSTDLTLFCDFCADPA